MNQETLAQELGQVFGYPVMIAAKRYQGKSGHVRFFPDFRNQVDVIGPVYDIFSRDTNELAAGGIAFSLVFRLDDKTVHGYDIPQYVQRTVRRWFPEFRPVYKSTPEGSYGPHN